MSDTYMAFEFVHPDFGRYPGDKFIPEKHGMQLAADGKISVVHYEAAVRQSILILLTTRPGERVMRPKYGCLLHTLVFSPNDNTTAGLAVHYARQALERWEPRVRIVKLDAKRNEGTPEVLDVELQYQVIATNRLESVVLSTRLTGGDQ